MTKTPFQSFNEAYDLMSRGAACESLPASLRLSHVLSMWEILKSSAAAAAGVNVNEDSYFAALKKEKPLAALSFFFSGLSFGNGEASYYRYRRACLERVEMILPKIMADIPVQRLCAAIPDSPDLPKIASFVKEQGFHELGRLLSMRANSQIKPKAGFA